MKDIIIIMLLSALFALAFAYNRNVEPESQECHVLPPAIMAPTAIRRVW